MSSQTHAAGVLKPAVSAMTTLLYRPQTHQLFLCSSSYADKKVHVEVYNLGQRTCVAPSSRISGCAVVSLDFLWITMLACYPSLGALCCTLADHVVYATACFPLSLIPTSSHPCSSQIRKISGSETAKARVADAAASSSALSLGHALFPNRP